MNLIRVVAGFTLVFGSLAQGPVSAEDRHTTRTFQECFLYRGSQGKVWVGHPLVSLGMIGVMDGPPQFHLSPSLAKRFAPLVNELQEVPKEPKFWWWKLPSLKNSRSPLVLIRIEARARLEKSGRRSAADAGEEFSLSPTRDIYEITSARLAYAEFVSASWRRAWKALDEGLSEIVTVSRTAPGKQKAERLEQLVEQASQALNSMANEKVGDSTRALIQKIDPHARSVRLFQRRVVSDGVGDWGEQLRAYAATLRVKPRTALWQPAPPCPKVELLAESSSARELLNTIKKSWPRATLEERLIYSNHLDRVVLLWQVEELTPAQFDKVRQEAKSELARVAAHLAKEANSAAARPASWKVPQWKVALRAAGPDLLAEKGMLRGIVVDSVSDQGSAIGLRAHDVIVDYQRVYDLVMGRHSGYERRVATLATYGGELTVLRGDHVIQLKVPRQK